jgi:hypothetical protein
MNPIDFATAEERAAFSAMNEAWIGRSEAAHRQDFEDKVAAFKAVKDTAHRTLDSRNRSLVQLRDDIEYITDARNKVETELAKACPAHESSTTARCKCCGIFKREC